jgi:rubredoxin
VYTNDVARLSKQVEELIFEHRDKFYDNAAAAGDLLYQMVQQTSYITKPVEIPLKLPVFNLPYYEGLNRYNDKYWMGIYRRDELFTVNFLKEVCRLCLQTKIGQLCSSPWKSLIIKGIEEKDRQQWSNLLAKHQVNVRHAANELNFQVEDNCSEGLALKNFLVKHLSNDDTRTFGICIGIKTRRKSEVFSSILVRRRPLLLMGSWEFLHVYDILCAKDFNPNERTGFVYSKGNPKLLLAEQLHRAILSFYAHQSKQVTEVPRKAKKEAVKKHKKEYVHQCKNCMTVYDETIGEPENGIAAGTLFEQLPATYSCSLCEAGKEDFAKVEKTTLGISSLT